MNSLQVPDVMADRRRHRRAAQSLCWLKPQAKRYVSEARYLGWLLNEAGVPIREIRMRRPGVIIWEDTHQIVAVPGDDRVPCAF